MSILNFTIEFISVASILFFSLQFISGLFSFKPTRTVILPDIYIKVPAPQKEPISVSQPVTEDPWITPSTLVSHETIQTDLIVVESAKSKALPMFQPIALLPAFIPALCTEESQPDRDLVENCLRMYRERMMLRQASSGLVWDECEVTSPGTNDMGRDDLRAWCKQLGIKYAHAHGRNKHLTVAEMRVAIRDFQFAKEIQPIARY